MRIRRVLCFWLGPLDTRVAAGSGDVGGTHDIRFCSVGHLVRQFVGVEPDAEGNWRIELEPYPEGRIGPYELRIAEYGGVRAGECALPTQYAGSGKEYSLWAKSVRSLPVAMSEPKDAIMLVKDADARYHARVVRREDLEELPDFMFAVLREFDQCGRLIDAPGDFDLVDMPTLHPGAEPAFYVQNTVGAEDEVQRVLNMPGAAGTETARERGRRSRPLAESVKRLYAFKCQLCDGTIPRIHIGGGRYYVEVHHLEGLAEVSSGRRAAGVTQETSELELDRASNIAVLCPHHHALMHHGGGGFRFDRESKCFTGPDGSTLALTANKHL